MGPKSSGCFCSSATASVSHAQGRVRRAGGPGARAPDRSRPGRAGASRGVWDDSAPPRGPASWPRGGSTSTARGESRWPWRPAATAAPCARVAQRAMGAEPPAPAWAPRPWRPLPARPRATGTPRSPLPAPDAPPRASSTRVPGAPRRGVAVVPMSWLIPRVSENIGSPLAIPYAKFNKEVHGASGTTAGDGDDLDRGEFTPQLSDGL